MCPIVDISPDVRYPILGATYQPRGGIAKHDNVAWGYARAAADRGVDLLEGTEVTGIDVVDGRVTGDTTFYYFFYCYRTLVVIRYSWVKFSDNG